MIVVFSAVVAVAVAVVDFIRFGAVFILCRLFMGMVYGMFMCWVKLFKCINFHSST